MAVYQPLPSILRNITLRYCPLRRANMCSDKELMAELLVDKSNIKSAMWYYFGFQPDEADKLKNHRMPQINLRIVW